MSNKTAKTLFIFSPFATEYAGLYQELLSGVASYQQLGNRLIQLAEQAHAFRQFDKVKEFGRLLSNIPIKNYQAIGHYFLAVAANSMGNGDQDKAKRLFELAIDTAPDAYKLKSVLSLGALAFNRMDFDSALYFYREPVKSGKLSAASIHAIRAISHLKSIEGSHQHAVKDLESVLPLIKHAPPHAYFDFLNSYAVELGEVGRMDEAESVSSLTVASPFAPYYPEWQSTFSEIRSKHKSRSTVSILVPQQQPEPEPESEPQTARVVTFPPLKEAPLPQKPEYVTSQELSRMSEDEKREFILAAIRSGAIHESEYTKFIILLGLLTSSASDQEIDLEDETTLNNLMIDWAHLIEPEELAAVMSALRDCEDDLRRTNIIDSIIRKAFEHSRTCNMTEAEWRLRVERRLPVK
jgi:tetratricopeptide (TPR) repeat protein